MDAVGARLATIRTTAGYVVDLGRHVYEWKSTPWADADMDGIDYRDPDDAIEVQGQSDLHALKVEFEIRVSGDHGIVPARMRSAIQDLATAIGTDDTFGGLALYARPLGSETMDIDQAEKRTMKAVLAISIVYATSKWGM